MTEWSHPFTNSLTDGGPISQASYWRIFRMLLGPKAEEADRGVIRAWDNELAATSPGADQVAIDTGAAFCHGTPYASTASNTLTADRPSTGTTGKRVVLRKDIVNGGVRLTVIASADGTATLPALTQSESTYWDIPICSFTHAINGAIAALTDEREFLVIGGGMKRSIGTGQYTLPAGPSAGATVTASSGSYGSYVEFEAAASAAKTILGAVVGGNGSSLNTYGQLRVGVGTPASEVQRGVGKVIRFLNNTAQDGGTYVPFDRPVRIAAGSRIAAQMADAQGQTWSVTLVVVDEADEEDY